MNSETQLTADDYFAVALYDIGITPDVIQAHQGSLIELVDKQLTLFGRDDKHMCQWDHAFAGPFYIRTVRIPKGMFLTTGRHLQWHSFYITQGCASWYDEKQNRVMYGVAGDPGNGQRYEHFVSLTEPGTRRLIFCHTDVVWSTVHPNPEGLTTVEEMEKYLAEFPNLNVYLK